MFNMDKIALDLVLGLGYVFLMILGCVRPTPDSGTRFGNPGKAFPQRDGLQKSQQRKSTQYSRK